MKPIVTFFGTQPYEQESFDALNRDFGFEFRYFKGHLSRQTVVATHGARDGDEYLSQLQQQGRYARDVY